MNPLPSTLAAPPSSAIRAPEFPAGFDWLNTGKPLTLRGLQGKIVLLDFWTYGCINCMHILPDLKKLERQYENELVIISVHSAKFENEASTANIRNIVQRYDIEHPVLVDREMRVWDSYAVRAWPTLVLIDPQGRIVTQLAGEGHYDELNRAIGALAAKFRQSGQLDETPLKLALEAARAEATPLRYPGKVLADAASQRVFIADSAHNRIVIADLNGEVRAVAGNGMAGFDDGSFAAATFHNPQGMALRDGVLYVADTNNHAIRALDLKNKTVRTIAGTGEQAPWRATGGVGTRAPLSSPWDVQLAGDTLYIAMAGTHQIWALDLKSGRVGPFAGSGREARGDGARSTAAFAQSSGLASDGRELFVADSETSTIRAVELPNTGTQVRTLAGGDLFDFGDEDGVGNNARLQHPLGVAYADGVLYIADTYNSKIKTLDPRTGRVATFLGDGGHTQFYEPGGLSIAGGKLYIADTNHHRVRVVDLATKAATTLELSHLPLPLPAEPERTPQKPSTQDDTIVLKTTFLAPDAKGEIIFDAQLPPGHKLNHEAPQRFQARVEGTGVKLASAPVTVSGKNFHLPLKVPFTTGAAGARGKVAVSATVSYCTADEGLCKFKTLRFEAPFEVSHGGGSTLRLAAKLP